MIDLQHIAKKMSDSCVDLHVIMWHGEYRASVGAFHGQGKTVVDALHNLDIYLSQETYLGQTL